MASPEHELVERYVSARRDHHWAVLEGFHPIKHAVRFGAHLEDVVVLEGTAEEELPPELDGMSRMTVDGPTFERLLPSLPPVPVLALARRPPTGIADVLASRGHVVLLERPTHAGNAGAVVRVAAAADAGGVVTVRGVDPWGPAALRGAAGLQFALPVAGTDRLPATDRPVVAFDDRGIALGAVGLPEDAVLAFGTERRGITRELREHADLVVRIPMRERVSSLNLATAVAVALYTRPGALDAERLPAPPT